MRRFAWLVGLLLPTAAWAQDKRAPPEETVPFALIENIVVTKGSLNGQEATWIVDTGTNQTIVTPAAARKASLDDTGRIVCPSIGAGDALVKDLQVVVDDPKVVHFMRAAGVEYDGILGTTFLDRFLFTLDYPNKRLIFAPLDSKPSGGTEVPFELNRNLIFVEAGINGKGAFKLLFDSGAQAMLIRPKAAERLGIEGRPSRQRPDVQWAHLDYVRVGEAAVGPLEVAIVELEQAQLIDPETKDFEGLLGCNFLSRFRVTIDYGKKTLYLASSAAREIMPPLEPAPEKREELEPEPEAPPAPLGVTLMETCVTEVEAGTPAARAGFRVGDIILAIDGQDVQLIEQVRAIVVSRKKDATLGFLVRRGKRQILLTASW